MKPFAIIKYLYVFKNALLSLSTSNITLMKYQFLFQGGDKTFNWSIAPAVSFPAHAAFDTMLVKQFLEITAGILRTPVRMMNKASGRMTAFKRHSKGIHDQMPGHSPLHGPADNSAGEEIQYCRQIKPALAGLNIVDVSSPDPIPLFRGKIALRQIAGCRQIMLRVRGCFKASLHFLLADHLLSSDGQPCFCFRSNIRFEKP
jgi:hypothetical protein